MAKKPAAEPNAKDFKFDDGPRAGDSLRLVNPPPKLLRLAFPEWCSYEYNGTSYSYLGPEPLSHYDRGER